MQNIKLMRNLLFDRSNKEHYLFAQHSLRALYPSLSDSAYRVLLSRAVASGLLTRVCREIYLFQRNLPKDGLLLFHIAALLRANEFNYISLETVLSDAGVISQIPVNWVSILSSGRSNQINCGEFGTIEFIHTRQKPVDVAQQLHYDTRYGLWRASVALALKDMRRMRRNCDLINWEIANELI